MERMTVPSVESAPSRKPLHENSFCLSATKREWQLFEQGLRQRTGVEIAELKPIGAQRRRSKAAGTANYVKMIVYSNGRSSVHRPCRAPIVTGA
jgi:hypothetical protein